MYALVAFILVPFDTSSPERLLGSNREEPVEGVFSKDLDEVVRGIYVIYVMLNVHEAEFFIFLSFSLPLENHLLNGRRIVCDISIVSDREYRQSDLQENIFAKQ